MIFIDAESRKLKTEYLFNLGIFLIMFSILLAIFILYPNKKENVDNNFKVVSKSVLLGSSGDKFNLVNLPTAVEMKDWYEYSFFVFELEEGSSIFANINAINLKYCVTCDDELIFTNENNYEGEMRAGARSIETFKIPKKYWRREIKIRFRPIIKGDISLKMPAITWGSKSAILKSKFGEARFEIYGGLLLFSISIVMFFLAFILLILKMPIRNIIYIASFSFLSGIYAIVRNWYVQNLVARPNFLYYLDYTALFLMTIFILLIVVNQLDEKSVGAWRVDFFNWMIIILALNVLSQLISTMFGGLEFIEMQMLTNVSLALTSFFLLLLTITIDAVKYKRKTILLLSMSPLLISFVSGFVMFGKSNDIKTSAVLLFGQIMFLFGQFFLAILKYRDDYNESENILYYEKIAFIDNLTKLGTRHTFERDMDYVKKNHASIDSILFMLIDLNALKTINDYYGHHIGDRLLKQAGNMINTVASKYNKAKGYRFGGDEFILVVYNVGIDTGNSISKYLKDESKEIRLRNISMPLSYAIGYEVINPDENINLNEMIKKVDEKMYADKSKDEIRKEIKERLKKSN